MTILRAFLAAAAAGGIASTCNAQDANTSHYCFSGTGSLLAMHVGASGPKQLAEVQQKCRPGDTLVIPAGESGAVALLCDFSKAIFNSGRDIICVFDTLRPTR